MARKKPIIQEGNAFLEWVFFWYSSSIAVSVRKQADNDKNSVSYRRLLEGIKLNPRVISRGRFIENFADSNYTRANASLCFDQLVGEDATHLDPAVVQQEIDVLVAKTSKLKHYVDKRIAHHDQAGLTVVPKFSDLDEALEYLGSLHKRYHSLFRCFELAQLVPTFLYDWKRPFQYPWLGP